MSMIERGVDAKIAIRRCEVRPSLSGNSERSGFACHKQDRQICPYAEHIPCGHVRNSGMSPTVGVVEVTTATNRTEREAVDDRVGRIRLYDHARDHARHHKRAQQMVVLESWRMALATGAIVEVAAAHTPGCRQNARDELQGPGESFQPSATEIDRVMRRTLVQSIVSQGGG